MLLQNLIRISSGRGANEVEDLRKASHSVVKLSLGYRDGFDGELRTCLCKPYFSCFGPETGSLRATFTATTDGEGRRSALETPTSSGVSSTLGMSDKISLVRANIFLKKFLNNSRRERVYKVYESLNTCISCRGHHFSTHVCK